MFRNALISTATLLAALSMAHDVPAQPSQLGWYAELAGSCWRGRNEAGRDVDRQCYSMQFGQFLRGTIEIGDEFRGDSIVGWHATAKQLVMYFWSNGEPRGAFDVAYEGDALIFEQPSQAGAPRRRNRWIRSADGGFRVVSQSHEDGRWVDGIVTTYRREGSAPAPFDAEAAIGKARAGAGAGFGWFGRLSGHCWEGTYPDKSGSDRQCYAWQFPEMLQASAQVRIAGAAHQGQAVYFASAGTQALTYYFWGSGGQFGAGEASWDGERLLLQQRGSATRTAWAQHADGFTVTVERLQSDAWVPQMTVMYAKAK